MTSPPPTTAVARLPASEARDRLPDLLRGTGREGRRFVLIGDDGTPVGALVPVEDVATLEELEAAEDREDAATFQQRLAEWRAAGGNLEATATLEDFARRHGLDLSGPEA